MQQALIVDDSKTARLTLGKMLARHQINVATVGSGEEALEYLQASQPDVIFMDHMMPGMDGFSVVKAIKSIPVTAAIPIVMYTTKQGDIYLGQAKALGAMDILAKPAQDQELAAVLKRIAESVSAESSVKVTEEELTLSSSSVSVDAEIPVNNMPITPQTTADSTTVVLSDERGSDVAPSVFLGSMRQWLVAAIWLGPIIWLLVLYFDQQHQIEQLEQRQLQWVESVEWLLNQRQTYDYGEQAMAGARLTLLKELIGQLQTVGFTGTVRMEGYVGDFCLSLVPLDDDSEILMLPAPDLPLVECDVIGLSTVQALATSTQQSVEFSTFVQSLSAAIQDIRVELVAFGASNPAYPYPDDLNGVSSGDWNVAAMNNNRVKFVLLPN